MRKEDTVQLVERAMTGDKEAFNHLCEGIVQEVLYLCVKLTGDYHLGQDAAQEVLLHLSSNITRLRSAGAFYAWLNRCISGTCTRVAVGEKRRRRIPLEYSEETMENNHDLLPGAFVENQERSRQVLACLETLPARQRHILYMYYYQNLSHEEMATALKTTPAASKMALHRARKALRRQLEKTGGPELSETLLHGIGPLSALLHGEAAVIITGEATSAVLAAVSSGLAATAAIGSAALGTAASGAGTAASTAAAGMAAGAAAATPLTALGVTGACVTTLLGVVAAGGIVLSSSSAPSSAPVSLLAEQSVPQLAVSQPFEEEGAEEFSIPSLTEVSPPVAGPVSSAGEAPAQPPAPVGEASLTVSGRVALVLDGQPLASSPPTGYTASLYQGEQLLATTQVDAGGSYQFNITVQNCMNTYIVLLQKTAGWQCDFAGGLASWQLEFTSAGGETLLPTAALEDNQPPTGSITLVGPGGEATALNPVAAQLSVQDATETHTTWQVAGEGDEVLATGEGNYVELATLPPLEGRQAGAFTLRYTATDTFGNASTFEQLFYLINDTPY